MPLGLLCCALCNDIYAVFGLSVQILEYVHLYSGNIPQVSGDSTKYMLEHIVL